MKNTTMKPGKNGYKIFFSENTVVMNYTFAKAAGQFGTPEYNLIKEIRKDFPNMVEVVISGREKKSPATNARLTYSNMESHISAYENAGALMEAFKTVKALSKTAASPYKYVHDWFVKQFPDYTKAPVLKDGKLVVLPIPAPNIDDYKLKMAG